VSDLLAIDGISQKPLVVSTVFALMAFSLPVLAEGLTVRLGVAPFGSLQMMPAGELPCQAGRMAIVNLQATVMDEDAWLVLHGRIDDVMHAVMARLAIPIPVGDCHHEAHCIRHQEL
jgi:hypothetical protein